MDTDYHAQLLIEQHAALARAVTDGRITEAQRVIAADVLDGKITDEEAEQRYAELDRS